MATSDTTQAVNDAIVAFQKASLAVQSFTSLGTTISTINDAKAFVAACAQLQGLVLDASTAGSALSAALGGLKSAHAATAQSIVDTVQTTTGQTISATPSNCSSDQFQGLRFYDGTAFGYLRVFSDKAEIVVGDAALEFPIDGTIDHTYRITGKGRNIKLYVDGQLAIDGTGKFVSSTLSKVIEFGDIAGRNQMISSAWSTFKYSVLGDFPPNSATDIVLEDVASFPAASVGRLKEYGNKLYASVDPFDTDKSSTIYSYQQGFDPETRSVLPITQAGVSCVLVDQARGSNVFGTSGKYIGTDSGLQYVLGSKPFPFDEVTVMSVLPDANGWEVDSNSDSTVASVSGDVLSIDTTSEIDGKYFSYAESLAGAKWVSGASNSKGWTVEAKVKVLNDGTNGSVDATAAASAACSSGEIDAPGVVVNDGTFQETVLFLQKGVYLKNAKLFGAQTLSDQFYTVRIIGKGSAIAVYAKGDSDPAFNRILFAPNGLFATALSTDRQEQPCVAADGLGATHAVWQDASGGDFSVYYSKLTGSLIMRGSGLIGSRAIDAGGSVIGSRIGFGLPPAASGIDYQKLPQNVVVVPAAAFKTNGVRAGNILYIYGANSPTRTYVISEVTDEILLTLSTEDDLGGLTSSDWAIATAEQSWTPVTKASQNALDSVDPRLIIHSSGDVFVAYANNQNGNNDIYVRKGKTDPFGITWSDMVQVTSSATESNSPDLVELPNGDIYVVWEDSSLDSTASIISGAVVPLSSFGGVALFTAVPLTTGLRALRRPRLAKNSGVVICAYEDLTAGLASIGVTEGQYSSTSAQVLPLLSLTISSSGGNCKFPSIASSPDGTFCVVWEDHAIARSQVAASVRGVSGAWSPQFGVSSSSGESVEPVVAADGAGNLYVAFADNRTRKDYFEIYLARHDAASGEWLSSAQRGLDTKVKSYLTDNRRPSLATAPDGSIALAWEACRDGLRTMIVGARFDGTMATADRTVVGYFPLEDNTPGLEVQNRIRTFGPGGLAPEVSGTAFNQTDIYTTPAGNGSAALLAPEGQSGFDIRQNGFGFSVPASLIGQSGGVDIRLRPHWDSTATGPFVFFGNRSLSGGGPNTIVCGVDTQGGVSSLKLVIADASNILHSTTVAAADFQWTAEQDLSLRATWENATSGVYQINGVNFVNASIGYACGSGGRAFKTTDGGANWTEMVTNTTYDLYSVNFVTSSNGLIVGEHGTAIRTTDSGATWSPLSTGVTADLSGVSSYSSTGAFAVGDRSTILHTTNNGDTWVAITVGGSVRFNDVFARPTNVIVVGDNGVTYVSTDLSAFSATTSSVKTNLNALSHSRTGPNGTCYAAGDEGVVLSTTDGGVTWVNMSPTWTTFAPDLHAVSQAATSATVWVVGQGGAIYRSINSGGTWTSLATTSTGTFRAIDASFDGLVSNTTAVISGSTGLVVMTINAVSFSYSYTKSGNLNLYINGVLCKQTRVNDAPFPWQPVLPLVFGDYQSAGTNTANSILDELVIYQSPPPHGAAYVRQEIRTYQASAVPVVSSGINKQIRFGSISPKVKTFTQWKSFSMFLCGAKEPLLQFGWDSTIGLVDDVVRDIAVSGNSLWIATENGVSVMDAAKAATCINAWLGGQAVPSASLFASYTNLAGGLLADSVNSICVDGLGNVWAATDSGIMMLPASSASSFSSTSADPTTAAAATASSKFGSYLTTKNGLPSNKVGIIRSSGNLVFAGTDAGLVVIDAAAPASTTVQNASIVVFTVADGLPSDFVKAISFDSDGQVFVGTDQGAVKLQAGCNRVVGGAVAVKNSDVYSIMINSSNVEFVGTGFGLVKIDGANISSYGPTNGLPTGAILGGSFDAAGSLWLATSSGLVEFNDACGTFTTFGLADGIVGNTSVVDYQNYRILGKQIPHGGCDKALVTVAVNGVQQTGGFSVNPAIPAVTFDVPLLPSDRVDVVVNQGWRKVKDFSSNGSIALLETDITKFVLYKKRFAAGSVIIGGNFAKGASNSSTHMYVVFAVSLTGAPTPISATSVGSIIPAAMEGTSVYSDSQEPIEVIPTDLVSVQMVALPSADLANVSDQYVTITLTTDSVVYVAYDQRTDSIPNWLRSFEVVKPIVRVSDMETFTDESAVEKLFVATKGTTGCVYDILLSPDICDVSATIAMDSTPPEGCVTISNVNATNSLTLSLKASDAVTGLVDMQVSSRPDFTTDGTTPVPFVPYQTTYSVQLPPSTNSEAPVDTIPPIYGTATILAEFNGSVVVGTQSPGDVLILDAKTKTLSLLISTGEQEVTALAQFGSNLIIGTGVNGRLFVWNGTTLSPLGSPLGESITALAAFNSLMFVGTTASGLPAHGNIYQIDSTMAISLFKATNEVGITDFAIFGSRLFFSTMNDAVTAGAVLNTTTTQGHRHTVVVQGGALRLGDVTGTSSLVAGHTHAIINGVVQPANSHTHILSGMLAGKVFSYDIVSGEVSLVHADKDYSVGKLASLNDNTGAVLFAGTFPNGKILRYFPSSGVFVRSFDTAFNSINALAAINGQVFAAAGKDVFYFDGTRWQFSSGSDQPILDFAPDGSSNVFLLKAGSITSSSPATASTDAVLCAYVRFRDAAGNVTVIKDSDGNFIQCYNPCVKLKDVINGIGSGGSAPTIAHRIAIVDPDANVLRSLSSTDPFYSGNEVELEVGAYESEVFNGTNSLIQWVSIFWSQTAQPGSTVTIAVRSATTQAGVAQATYGQEFSDPLGNDLTNLVGQFLQFRATLTVNTPGVPSPVLHSVNISLRTSQAVHYFTTNFKLPDNLTRGILTANVCINPPVTDLVFGISGLDTTNFKDYVIIEPGKVFNLPAQHQTPNMRIGIKLISSPQAIPVVDEFALLFALANDAIVKLNLAGMPGLTSGPPIFSGPTRTVSTDQVQGHVHSVTFDSSTTDKSSISGTTSTNAGHSHLIVNGVIQPAAGHSHTFSI